MRFERVEVKTEGALKEVHFVEMAGDGAFLVKVTKDGMQFCGNSPVFRTKDCLRPLMSALQRAISDYWQLAKRAGVSEEEMGESTDVEPPISGTLFPHN